MQFGEKRTDKHFKKQTNAHAVWTKIEWKNIQKNRHAHMQFEEKTNRQTFKLNFEKKANAVLRNRGSKNEWTNI